MCENPDNPSSMAGGPPVIIPRPRKAAPEPNDGRPCPECGIVGGNQACPVCGERIRGTRQQPVAIDRDGRVPEVNDHATLTVTERGSHLTTG